MSGFDDAAAVDEAPPVTPATAPWVRPGWWGGAAGIASLAAGLGAAELAAGFRRTWRNPVVSVGDRVIDLVPKPVKDLAISLFGTADKAVLVVVTVAVLVALAASVGRRMLGAPSPRRAVAWALGLGAVGALAAASGRDGSLGGAVPSAVAAATAAGSLVAFHRWANAPVAAGTDRGRAVLTRRRFLTGTTGVAASAVATAALGCGLRRRFSAALERAGVVLPRPGAPLPAPPADRAATVERLSPLFTPNDRFYRIDTALVVPSVSIEDWTLSITGMVERPVTLTFDELVARDLVEVDCTLSCVSNQVGGDLVGNARWLGVRLDALLAEVGVRPGADQVMSESVDGFTAGFPLAAALDGRDALVAVGMNGEPLPVRHGYPARLVVPGLYGYVSATKWLRELRLTTFDREAGYWIPRGWAVEAPVKTQSRIDTPRSGRPLAAGPVAVAGVAWAPTRGIARVEVQVDDGPWRDATLGPELADTSWRQWWVDWDATAGRHRLRVRATDGTGATQVEQRSRPDPDGATGWHTVVVDVR